MNFGIVISPTLESTSHLPIRKQLPEPKFYEQLSELGEQADIFVYVFRATDYNNSTHTLTGYRYVNGQWLKMHVPLPHITLDRTFFHNKMQQHYHHRYMDQIEKNHHFLMFNAALPNKLVVYEQLKQQFPSLIPPSQHYEHFSMLQHMLNHYEDGVVLKPLSGTHGKGIIQIKQDKNNYTIYGRQLNNQPLYTSFSSSLALQKWLLYFRQNHAYLLQPYYHFQTADGEPYDIRVLMQKNKHGKWQVSGAKARVGKPNQLTSNLHGGGHSRAASSILEQLFSQKQAAHLGRKIHMISGKLAEELEKCFGRFGELALDFGITQKGNIVLLECNSKPGRKAFLTDQAYEQHVIAMPLAYANYLYIHYLLKTKIGY